MRINVNSLDIVYKILNNFPAMAGGEKKERWQESLKYEEEDEIDDLRKIGAFRYPFIELPRPLRHVELHIRRSFNSYSAYFLLSAWNSSAFKGVSIAFTEKLNEQKFDFKDFNNYPNCMYNGIGAVVNLNHELEFKKADRHFFHVMRAGKKGEMRDIGMGCNGAYQRVFPDNFEDFIMDFNDPKCGLITITNKFIESCYCEKVIGSTIDVPDLTLYLNP